jgi:AraC-like DNA-binding protein
VWSQLQHADMARHLFAGELSECVPAAPRHVHEHWELVCYVEGAGTITVGNDDIAFDTGMAIALPPHIPHAEVSPPGFRCLFLGYEDLPGTSPVIVRDVGGMLATTMRLLIREQRSGAADADAAVADLLAVILRWIRRWSGESADPLVRRAEELILGGWRDPAFSIGDLARDVGCSADRLTRRFRAATGVTPRERLTRLRIDEARSLLAQGHGVAETAALVGFNDPFWFSRQFHRLTGETPRDIRAQRC